ncbi:helix-turn-helix domain-containing protein [Dictyobacter halimunensis]
MQAIASEVGLSQRHFIQVFGEAVGLTPKLFCRVQRFQALLRSLEYGRPVHWAEAALNCGYYDQAHCIHDFQAFSGLTPSTYLSSRGQFHNHVPL